MAQPTLGVLDKDGVAKTINTNAAANAIKANSPTVGLSVEDAAYLDGIEGLLTTIDGRVDGLETLIGSTNTKLDSLIAATKAEDAVHASGDVGQMALAVRKDTATALAGADGDYAPLEVDASGRLYVNIGAGGITSGTAGSPSTDVVSVQGVSGGTPVSTSEKPSAAANGLTSSRVVAAASTNAASLKAAAGNLASIDVFNVAAYDVFLKFYNKASAPTVGTDTPVWTIPLKAGTGYSARFPVGKSFATGIAYAITKLQADSDTTVLVAGDVTGSIDWI